MKKLILIIGLLSLNMAGMASLAGASVWDELHSQVIEQTKITIHKSGGPAGFYDASTGNDFALKQGVLSHVVTNRFIAASLGWYTADNQSGVLVGGPSVKVKDVFTRVFPQINTIIPALMKPLDVGFNYGWGTDRSQHYGIHVMYDFGGGE